MLQTERTNEDEHSKKKMTKKTKVILAIVIIVIAVLVTFTAFAAVYIKDRMDQLDRIDITEVENNISDDEEEEDNYTTIALFGVDNRSNGNFETGNSDAILVASINNDTKEVRLSSVYRDTYLNTGDDKYRKANYAYASGGPTKAISMLNKNLDLDIDGYITVDFNALVEVIDLVGGIELDVTSAEAEYMIGYIDEVAELSGQRVSYVSAGLQTLNGVQATAYSRVRYTSGGDYTRAERQREVIEQVVEKMKASSYSTLCDILDSVVDDISTSFTNQELLGFAVDASKYEITEMTGFPFDKCSHIVGSLGSIVIPVNLDSNVEQLHEFLFPDVLDYELSNTVEEYSEQIVSNIGQYEAE